MKKSITGIGVLLLSCMSFNMAFGGKASVELGEKLFNDPSLGGSKNTRSCATCHPNGEGMEKAADRDDLVKMINRCIVGALAGEKLDGRSAEMLSLKMYIISQKK